MTFKFTNDKGGELLIEGRDEQHVWMIFQAYVEAMFKGRLSSSGRHTLRLS